MLTYVVKVHCNVQLLDRIEEIALSGANIEWFSDQDSDLRSLTFELFETFTNFIIS